LLPSAVRNSPPLGPEDFEVWTGVIIFGLENVFAGFFRNNPAGQVSIMQNRIR
jgi:hypothetical protein